MAYPDLMFLSQIPVHRIFDDAFEDMKLKTLLGDETLHAMNIPCERDDIIARQEMFSAMKNSEARDHMTLLKENITAVSTLAERYENARCDSERYILFANLAKAISHFFSNASKNILPSELYTRFCDYFAKRCENTNYKQLVSDLDVLMPKVEDITVSQYKISGDNVKVSLDTAVPYVERLLADAECLGIARPRMQAMEARVLDCSVIEATAKLHPDLFSALGDFHSRHKNFYERELLLYRTSITFYTEICDMLDMISSKGIPVCFPKIASQKKIDISSAYDITLLTKGETNIIPNDVYFDEKEPFFYLTGANGGGKTTYLRTVGISTILFLNGCPCPCERAEIYPLHNVFTHFPRDERFDNAGRNAEEQIRVKNILDATDHTALVLLNETYSTTSEEVAMQQTAALAETMYRGGEFGVYVTHQHSTSDGEIPYLNVIIDVNDSNRRTYKVARQNSVYSSYARDILQKYSLTKEELDRRFGNIN